MKTSLFFALIIVSNLTCIAPAGAKVPEYNSNASLINNGNNSQFDHLAAQPKNKVLAVKPAYSGKPKNPIPAGRR